MSTHDSSAPITNLGEVWPYDVTPPGMARVATAQALAATHGVNPLTGQWRVPVHSRGRAAHRMEQTPRTRWTRLLSAVTA